jgi:FixJ family two-component response regulator
VVDDDFDVRIALSRLMASAGFAVESFGSGAAFLKSVDDHEPDCVLLDVHMPDVSGFEIQEALAVGHGSIPIIVITGHDSPESRGRALGLGAKGYLCKPIDDEALLSAIDAAIAGRARSGS